MADWISIKAMEKQAKYQKRMCEALERIADTYVRLHEHEVGRMCPHCKGEGYLSVYDPRGGWPDSKRLVDCEKCGGEGRLWPSPDHAKAARRSSKA